jgi:hypothetical protein
MITIETISIVFTGLSISLAAFYYINTLRNSKKNQELQLETRQAQLFMQIYDKLTDKEFVKDWTDFVYLQEWDDYNDYIEKYGYRNNLDAWSARIGLSNYFEGIGVLIKRELIDPALVDDLMSSGVMGFWEKWGPIVEEYRKDFDNPQMSEYQEYLYNRIKSIAKEQHPELNT